MKTLTLLSLVFFISCQLKTPYRSLSQVNHKILSLIQSLHYVTQNKISSHQECSSQAKFYYDRLYDLDVKNSNFLSYSKDELREILDLSFESRLAIREKLKGFDRTKKFEFECLKYTRDLTRALRYMEDYVVEQLEKDRLKSEYTTLKGSGSYFLKDKDEVFKDYLDLKSGDIILSRGKAFSSAAIARIGIHDAQFSHLTLVYKDDRGELHTIESHIEIGAVSMPFQYHLDEKNARTVVFRYHDEELAHLAAKHMYYKVKNYTETQKKNIDYDFGMDYQDNKSLFCSEVIYDGFYHASQKRVSVPLYRTKFSPKLLPFLQNIGIKVNKSNVLKFQTFGPGDIEFDPRFKLIAEWRNPLKMKESRVRDAILTKMFEWMEERKYRFRPSSITKIKSQAAWFLRRLGQYQEKFPLNMKVKQLQLFQVLDEVGTVLENKIHEGREEEILSFEEMYDILEKFRGQDQKDFKNPFKRSQFHQKFR